MHDPTGVYAFRQNDKVMQVVNDYYKDVYNGEIGRVAKVEDGLVQVSRSLRMFVFQKEETRFDFHLPRLMRLIR